MTITTSTVRWSYTGNGVTTAFAYNSKIFAQADLKVYLDGVLKTLTTDYTVSGVGEVAGGSVTFLSAPGTGVAVAIVKDTAATQESSLPAIGPLPSEVIETGLDKLTSIAQQLEDDVLRSVRAPTTDPVGLDMVLPAKASRVGKLLAFDATTGAPVATDTDYADLDGLSDDIDEVAASAASAASSAATAATQAGIAATKAAEAAASAASIATPIPVASGGTGATSAADARTNLGVAIGSDVQGYDADTLKADVSDDLTAGFTSTSVDAGTKSSGTFTPAFATGNIQHYTNGGAHTLAPPSSGNGTLVIDMTNNGSAGAVTTSGFTKVEGATLTTTNGHKFRFFISVGNGGSHLNKVALQ